ncbi:MAG: hypothetical protein EOP10_04495 [Proteobacteria bacterium]|nr:MAG: hypothetical protein EOP10_04495 [Pseudomonadota bacterium]
MMVRFKSFLFVTVTSASIVACGKSDFKGKVGTRSQEKPATSDATPSPDADASVDPDKKTVRKVSDPSIAGTLQALNFNLSVNNGSAVAAAENAGALPSINNSLDQILSDGELKDWQVKIHPESITPNSAAPVAAQFVDLSASAGLTRVVAEFENIKDKSTGSASQVIYVDSEAPKVRVIRLSDSADGTKSKIVWSATDNYKLDESKTLIIGCKDFLTSFSPRYRADLNVLPAGCAPFYTGDEVHKLAAEIEESARVLANASVLPRDIKYAIYAEDLVGLSSFAWITQDEQGLLSLAATPTVITYTNKLDAKINLKLLHVKGPKATQVELAANSALWPEFETRFGGSIPAVNAPANADFKPEVDVKLGDADGAYVFATEVAERSSGLKSNQQVVRYILDRTPPKVDSIQISIDKIVPSASSTISISWKATDANPIVSQVLEVKGASDTAWTKVSDLGAAIRSTSFAWGNRKVENFELRIRATDIATNVGEGSSRWVKQIFNAAVLTTSVQCYFCHMKIHGDVGGIDFPASVRDDSGRNFQIVGKLFGTNKIPNQLIGKSTAGEISNYDNSGLKIFPKNNQFPVFSAADLKPKMNGSITVGANAYGPVHEGNLVLDGTQNPILIKGETFINGDLIIKGKYKGVGTIYAQNIYIVGDVVAERSPFPFSEVEATALQQAQESVARGDDGLYLGALNQIVAGVVQNGLNDEVDQTKQLVTDKPTWLDAVAPVGVDWLPEYNTFGVQTIGPRDLNGALIANFPRWGGVDPVTDWRYRMEVVRVDAYLYSQKIITWRSYSSLLLNGGFMTPKGGFVSSMPELIYNNSSWKGKVQTNARNGIAPEQNQIRYDFRLRIGAGGFDTLKTFFDQQ